MRNRIFYVLILVFIALSALSLSAVDKPGTKNALPTLEPLPIHPRVEQAIAFFLPRMHYKHQQVDDKLSSEMLDFYIDLLDNQHLYFLKSDIDLFNNYKYTLDDALRNGDLRAAYFMFNLFMKRFQERMDFIPRALEKPFDFNKDESFEPDRKNAPWATTSAELDSLWKKRLKNEALSLKLAGKKWDDIVKRLKKRYKNMDKNMMKTESEDVFQVFMNAFAETFDPHTNYMSPKTSDDFKIRMSLSLEGIGATLQTEDDYTKVVSIVPGGPADKSGLLHPNDRIVAVGQGEKGEMVDVIGWRIDDVVQLIRGKKGTKVRLQIIPADASLSDPPKTITIVRDRIKLSDRAAKSDTLEIVHNGQKIKIGVIDVPDFYLDYEAMRKGLPDYASTSRDVAKLLRQLEGAGVKGIIIDLRRNGGGFLSEAVDLTGLFIKDGPVVQVRDSRGRVKVERDEDPKIIYKGPLAVLVDRFSASASEIFTAAIQDYQRGIIVGSQTYGKGTVQNIMPLSRMFPHTKEKLGQIKFTIAKFYRVNGGSTQLKGVMPDIAIPSRFDVLDVGESSEKNALAWDEIEPVSYDVFDQNLPSEIPRLKQLHKKRLAKNVEYKLILKEINEIKQERKKNRISLNLAERKKLRDEREKRKKELQKLHKKTGQKKNEDFYLIETAHILSDYAQMIK
ncbi:tail-specific protease [candidate division KSB1 bacterium]|nr:MAG: tail-specific protease [candidate division KSB1 bacterium]